VDFSPPRLHFHFNYPPLLRTFFLPRVCSRSPTYVTILVQSCLGIAVKWLCIRIVARVCFECFASKAGNMKSGIYHKTSVDTVKSNRTTLSLAGQKRKYGEFWDKQSLNAASPLVDITNTTDFQRPTVHQENFLAPLEAGKIRDVVDRDHSVYSQRRGLALTPTVSPILCSICLVPLMDYRSSLSIILHLLASALSTRGNLSVY
jgi:hypothetical protein